jgi:3alpha(or 20beta)-hydroxysteroid dehydrogenase
MGRVTGKVALVTGGARGQGAAHARLLASEGAAVLIGDVLDDEGAAVAEEIRAGGSLADYIRLDVSDPGRWADAVAHAENMYGRLDVLVNNAGIVGYSDVTDCSDDEWQRVIAVNQTGVFFGMRAAIPALRRAGGGSIINVSSVFGGVCGVDGYIAYGASKAAVYFMTKSAAITYGPESIRVNAIAPGALDTVMLREELAYQGVDMETLTATIPLRRAAAAGETSPTVVFLASDESAYITGILVTVDGGVTLGVGF